MPEENQGKEESSQQQNIVGYWNPEIEDIHEVQQNVGIALTYTLLIGSKD